MSCFNLNIKKRRASPYPGKPFTFKKHTVLNTYTKTNPQLNSRYGFKDESGKCSGQACLKDTGCGPPCITNNVEIRDICLNEWQNKFQNGNIFRGNPEVKIHSSSSSAYVPLGRLKDLLITGTTGCFELGKECSCAFYNSRTKQYDRKINILLIIQPGPTHTSGTSLSNITLTIGNNTPLSSDPGGFQILDNFIIKSGVSNRGKPYINPIAGYRKALICCPSDIQHPLHTKAVEWVYQDQISYWYGQQQNVNTGKNCIVYDTRIRSGMQPIKKCNKASDYAFSYAQYNKNRLMNTYDRGLEIYTINDNENIRSIDKDCSCNLRRKGINCNNCINKCDTNTSCNNSNTCTINRQQTSTVWKPNNKKFKVQGAVCAGSRLERLKLDTIKAANSNPNGRFSCKGTKSICDSNKVGRGPYFAGKPRFDGWMYNKNHKEVVNYNTYRQTPFGVPQLLGNSRQTRSIKSKNNVRENKDIGIVTQRKNNCC